jgi:Putative zinc-finger
MTHPSTERLSEFLDSELDAEERRSLESHLGGCEECRALLAELRRVLSRAQALEDRPPRQDLWPGVAAAIGAAPARRRGITVPVPVLLAAGVALMLLSATAAALVFRSRPVTSLAEGRPSPAVPALATPAANPDDAHGYDAAVRRLEAEVAAGGGRLDSVTVRVVRDKLRLIDRAIVEAEQALAADSGNTYLHGHLTQTRLRKLDLLRRAAALARQVS